MPVAVVALAAGSFAAGASAFAAASTVAGMVAAGATMAGAALTIVGTVTGNAKLTKIGAIVGIAGSLGTAAINMASGAEAAAAGATSGATDAATGAATDAASGAAGDAASAITTSPVDLGSGAAAGTDAAAGSASMGGNVMTNVAGTAPQTAMPGSLLSAADPVQATPVAVPKLPDLASSDVLGSGNQAAQAGAASFDTGSTTVGQSTNINAFKAPTPFQQLANQGASNGDLLGSMETSGMPSTGFQAPADPGIVGTLQGYGNSIQNWAKANPILAKAALDGTSAFVKGMAPTAQEKQMMAYYKAQTDAVNRRALWGSGRV